ncbi:class I tRNA ligase family protein [Umezawaea endophytica]|uniref:Class I tRNA ligase family protein n=1 Tax=Umezawaea endophytica TaxID=1654476 RepID=A0A9X2VNR9_9PSEU|nr:class I tRNA ligase family protein [Umezawaea endophytica]MCS7478628.1 class I tRNA ligase family protein [Umezawaea endophytica]
MSRCYLTTAVAHRGEPGLGYALEVVRADALARHRRLRGDRVRFLTGADSEAFADLREPLALSYTEFATPGRDGRHPAGVDRLWLACAEAGDVHRDAGAWYFRLSRHVDRLRDLIGSGKVRLEPAARRDEVLDLLADGLPDVAVSGPGVIPVPGDEGLFVDPWWDEVATYVTSLGHGVDGPNVRRWWTGGDRRVHVVGHHRLREHAVLWPAVLLSAGLPLPTDVLVQDAVATGERETAAPGDLARRYGSDAVRWWLLRDGPETTDFAASRVVTRANGDLAKGLADLVDQITVMVHRYRAGKPPVVTGPVADAEELEAVCRETPERVHDALAAFDFRQATAAVWRVVEEARAFALRARPWDLARADREGDVRAGERLDAVLAAQLSACRVLARELTPFVPALATRIAQRCITLTGALPPHQDLFRRL